MFWNKSSQERLTGTKPIDTIVVLQPLHTAIQSRPTDIRLHNSLATKHSNALEQPPPPKRITLGLEEPHAQDPLIARPLNDDIPVQRLLAVIESLDADAESFLWVRERVRQNRGRHGRHGDAEAVQRGEDEFRQSRGGDVGVEARERVRGHDVAELAGGLCEG
jgi:hypothetical protein